LKTIIISTVAACRTSVFHRNTQLNPTGRPYRISTATTGDKRRLTIIATDTNPPICDAGLVTSELESTKGRLDDLASAGGYRESITFTDGQATIIRWMSLSPDRKTFVYQVSSNDGYTYTLTDSEGGTRTFTYDRESDTLTDVTAGLSNEYGRADNRFPPFAGHDPSATAPPPQRTDRRTRR